VDQRILCRYVLFEILFLVPMSFVCKIPKVAANLLLAFQARTKYLHVEALHKALHTLTPRNKVAMYPNLWCDGVLNTIESPFGLVH
jgi:hypothetical protein